MMDMILILNVAQLRSLAMCRGYDGYDR